MYIEYGIIVTVVLLSVIFDLQTHKVPNAFLLPCGVLGLGSSYLLRGPEGFLHGILGMIVPIILLFFLFIIRVLGAGDIKLFAVLGCFFGYDIGFIMAYSFLAGGVLAVLYFIFHHHLKERILYFLHYVHSCCSVFIGKCITLPKYQAEYIMHFTPAICIGTICFLVGKENLIASVIGYLV